MNEFKTVIRRCYLVSQRCSVDNECSQFVDDDDEMNDVLFRPIDIYRLAMRIAAQTNIKCRP